MTEITHVLGTKQLEGKTINIVRNHFLHEEPRDIFKEIHKEFTYDQKKAAKINHKNN